MVSGLVSVLICCYNGAGYIASCFNCLLAQTYKKFEIIFINDGSLDNSYDIALGFSKTLNDNGIGFTCLNQSNQGVGFASANGLHHANGEFISNLDIDDYLYPDSLQKRVFFLQSNPDYALVRTNGYRVDKNGQKNLFVTRDTEKEQKDIFEDLLLGQTNNWPGSYMVRATSLWNVYPNRQIPCSRYGQNLQILMSVAWNNKAGFIDIPLVEYRFNPHSLTSRDTAFEASYDRYMGFWQIRKDILAAMKINNPDLLDKLGEAYGKILMDLCIYHGKRQRFLAVYQSTATIHSTSLLYKYYYHRYSGRLFSAFVFRCLNYLQNHSKR